MWLGSPSASFSTTGRCAASRLERGPCAGRPNPAASPASRESPGAEGSPMRLSSCGSFMAWGSVTTGISCPRIRAEALFAREKSKKGEQSGKRSQEACCFLFEFGRAAGLMERQDCQESGSKLLSGQGIGVVQPRRIGSPKLGNGPDGQVLLEAQPQEVDALDRLAAALGCALPVQPGRLGHDRLRPGAVEEMGLACVIRRDFRQRACGTYRPALEPASDIADDPVEEGAKGGHPASPGDLHCAALAETLDEHLLRGIVKIVTQRRAAPAGGQVRTDGAEIAAGPVPAGGRSAWRP